MIKSLTHGVAQEFAIERFDIVDDADGQRLHDLLPDARKRKRHQESEQCDGHWQQQHLLALV